MTLLDISKALMGKENPNQARGTAYGGAKTDTYVRYGTVVSLEDDGKTAYVVVDGNDESNALIIQPDSYFVLGDRVEIVYKNGNITATVVRKQDIDIVSLEQSAGTAEVPDYIIQDLASIRQEVSSFSDDISVLQVTVDNVEVKQETQTTDLTDVQSKNTQQDTSIQSNSTAIQNLTTRVSSLETKLNNIGTTVGNSLFPIGSVVLTIGTSSPASYLGGSWTQITGNYLLAAVTNKAGQSSAGASAQGRAGDTGGTSPGGNWGGFLYTTSQIANNNLSHYHPPYTGAYVMQVASKKTTGVTSTYIYYYVDFADRTGNQSGAATQLTCYCYAPQYYMVNAYRRVS